MRLLLAEDEKELSRALVTILKHNNYTVDAVYNGQDALDYLESGLYDGAILDIMMPRLDGLTVLRRIREKKLSLPVLLLTAKAEVDNRLSFAGLSLDRTDFVLSAGDFQHQKKARRAPRRRTDPHGAESRIFIGDNRC